MKFQQRIERSPQQVWRYCFGGDALPMSDVKLPESTSSAKLAAMPQKERTKMKASKTVLPRCIHCGAKRVFECQLLASLIYEVGQNCPNFLMRKREKGESLDTLMDFGSIFIYTCENDCMGGDKKADISLAGGDNTVESVTFTGEPMEEIVFVEEAQ